MGITDLVSDIVNAKARKKNILNRNLIKHFRQKRPDV
jgi:hypothetical protein